MEKGIPFFYFYNALPPLVPNDYICSQAFFLGNLEVDLEIKCMNFLIRVYTSYSVNINQIDK